MKTHFEHLLFVLMIAFVLCVPSLFLIPILDTLGIDSTVKVGAQNSAAYPQGAYTGEIAADQLSSAGIPYVIVGHSERRTLFGETDSILKTKVDLRAKNTLQ